MGLGILGWTVSTLRGEEQEKGSKTSSGRCKDRPTSWEHKVVTTKQKGSSHAQSTI